MKNYKVKNLKSVVEAFAATLPPVDHMSGPLENSMIEVARASGSYLAIDKDGGIHDVYYVGNWAGRIYLGSNTYKVDLDNIELIYQSR